ncbi:MAG: Trp biosynthesis-associated membrane protein [Micrococcales bacterium]
MNQSRALALLAALQLLSILLLTQTWFSISMAPNGQSVVLGDYSGADANPSAMATSLFLLVGILVIAFTSSIAKTVALAVVTAVAAALASFVAFALISKNISALDSALDKLTGIAQTHGINDLTIEQSPSPIIWLASQTLVALVALAALVYQRRWADQAAARKAKLQQETGLNTAKSKKTLEPQTSAIDLWDDQRS